MQLVKKLEYMAMYEYTCEITDSLTERLRNRNRLYKVYVYDYSENMLAIRVPGKTIGYVALNDEHVVTEIVIYEENLRMFYTDPNELCKRFIGEKIDNYKYYGSSK